jgi:hypothetical protein
LLEAFRTVCSSEPRKHWNHMTPAVYARPLLP